MPSGLGSCERGMPSRRQNSRTSATLCTRAFLCRGETERIGEPFSFFPRGISGTHNMSDKSLRFGRNECRTQRRGKRGVTREHLRVFQAYRQESDGPQCLQDDLNEASSEKENGCTNRGEPAQKFVRRNTYRGSNVKIVTF